MTRFLGPDFLLDTPTARRLFHDVAKPLPIVDFHNHLSPQDIAQDRKWDNLGELWLAHDHYKWRLMRWAGVPESHVTGSADFRAKYDAFAGVMPRLVGNPVHHWSHLELWRHFGLDGIVLDQGTAAQVWDTTAEQLQSPACSARGLLRQMNVAYVATTDDPCDTLEHHIAFAAERVSGLRMVPTFRPDPALYPESDAFGPWLERLEDASGMSIHGWDDLLAALIARLDHFCACGAVAADHGLNGLDLAAPAPSARLDEILIKARLGGTATLAEASAFRNALLVELGRAYAARDMVMQLHIGPLRNTRSRLLHSAGRDAGADSLRDAPLAEALNAFLDLLDRDNALPRTILYALDPSKTPVIVTTAGNFQDGSLAGKVQPGTAWWFNDQLDGMEAQMRTLAQMGLISTFLGMLTDSRSFLSFPRHEYFRRLLCKMIGNWAETGHLPDDPELLENLVRDICLRNAAKWFGVTEGL
ncbi:MAG: glucuronate isomerase UxaC [Roseibaca calidilacus]|uniref:Uronate isomerase n=1 Tax=Roseibaca calidilacus TaxID=1666912 RepID=A0A0P7VZ82_9RHOB|nr:glucuronate isomerase [Roseibaca calidilacus]KPP92861.1 MAG: glucuronate isomerase UxaC [Roseibaca calidilacus]CUX80067.1 D-glucuronate isomerase [Roseibaca calidilacus]